MFTSPSLYICNRLPVPPCFLLSDLLITVLLLSRLPTLWLGHRLGHRLGQLSLCCPHLSHVYIEALELHSISSRSCNSITLQAYSKSLNTFPYSYEIS